MPVKNVQKAFRVFASNYGERPTVKPLPPKPNKAQQEAYTNGKKMQAQWDAQLSAREPKIAEITSNQVSTIDDTPKLVPRV